MLVMTSAFNKILLDIYMFFYYKNTRFFFINPLNFIDETSGHVGLVATAGENLAKFRNLLPKIAQNLQKIPGGGGHTFWWGGHKFGGGGHYFV